MRAFLAAAAVLLVTEPASARDVAVGDWRVVTRESGPDVYYTQVRDPALPFLRAHYRPPMQTAVMGWEVPEDLRAHARTLRWKWRAEILPAGRRMTSARRARGTRRRSST